MYSGADLKSEAFNEYCRWMRVKSMDPETRREVQSMITDMDMIDQRFGSRLAFGTAGLRAPEGAGTNRMNPYTVAAAARGFARWIKANGGADRGIVISYDSRHRSRDFAEMTARMAADEGVQVYLSDTLRPVPMLSYGIVKYGAAGGVMITASHNPPEYNGFKAYGADGAQLMPEEAAQVSACIEGLGDIFQIISRSLSFRQLFHNEMIVYVGEELDDSYEQLLMDRLNSSLVPDEAKRDLRIVYTPLNGAGNIPVRRVLESMGFHSVMVVPEQELPDGTFPTLRVPNPEYEDTFRLAIEMAETEMADIVIATDPDGDRLGIALPDDSGEYRVLTGNQIGTLLMEFMLGGRAIQGRLKGDEFSVVSVVSTKMPEFICRRYGVELTETLTGSRYTAEAIRQGRSEGKKFVMGFEEGNGYMLDTGILDKDGVAAAAVIAEMAAMSRTSGRRLYDQLDSIYSLYCFPAEKRFSVQVKGLDITGTMEAVMNNLREESLDLGDGIEITGVRDYMPETNMLYYHLGGTDGNDWLAIRPSGTEPKLKVYMGMYGEKEEAANKLAKVYPRVKERITAVIDAKGEVQ